MKNLIVSAVMLPFICFGASVVHTIDAPDTQISGLAWGEGKLWAFDETSCFIYGLDPVSGDILQSFEVIHTGAPDWTPAGLAFNDGMVFSSFHKANYYSYVYFYTSAGVYVGNDPIC